MSSNNLNNNTDETPEAYLCALTKCLMTDPVIDTKGGYTYERSAIEQWLGGNRNVCPITRRPLNKNDLVPNRALKDAITEWQTKLQEQAEVTAKERKEQEEDSEVPSAPGGPAAGRGVVFAASAPALLAQEENKSQGKALGQGILTAVMDVSNASVLLKINPPEGRKRTPVDLVCVIDTSYSMSEEATVQNAAGKKEKHGLSLLDVVKHATRMILEMSSDKDRVSLVSFSAQAKTVLPLTVMNKAGKQRALAALDQMRPDANTNLWDGLYTGLEVLRTRDNANRRLPAVALLTDGQPNVEPPRGHLPALQKYKDSNPFAVGVNISTFGFGYNLDSALLDELAREGGGRFAFIPDSGFVGTIFVHCLANLLSTYAQQVQLTVEPQSGVPVDSLNVPGLATERASWGLKLDLGTVCYGQSRDVVVSLRPEDVKQLAIGQAVLGATVKYTEATGGLIQQDSCTVIMPAGHGVRKADLQELEAQRQRLHVVDVLGGLVKQKAQDLAAGRRHVAELIASVRASKAFKQHAMVALVQDLQGQITQAYGRQEYFQKWGRHFLPSLLRAHQLQECNNFKDPGVQVYGGKLFNKLRDEADEIFLKLKPPKPSIKRQGVVPVANMRTYHNRGGGCFTGECLVSMADGSQKRVDHIKKGDTVVSGASSFVRVQCVLKTVATDGIMELVTLKGSGLRCTPWHPVRLETSKDKHEWVFPMYHGTVSWQACDAVYTFLVDGAFPDQHSMVINNVVVVTLANGATGDVRAHDFFGTGKVVDVLRRAPGFAQGLVEVKSGCLIKDPHTGLVCDLRLD